MVVLRDGDYMKHILSYIEKNSARGYTVDQIKFTLMQQGYSRAAIERGLRMYEQNKPKVEPKREPVSVSEQIPAVQPIEEKKGFFSKLFGIFSSNDKEQQ